MKRSEVLLMIVAGDQTPRRDLEGLFPARGRATCLATTAAGALVLLNQGMKPDGLILGMKRPDETGATVLHKVREAGLPALTAICADVADAESLERLWALRPNVVLVRPLDADSINKVYEDWSQLI